MYVNWKFRTNSEPIQDSMDDQEGVGAPLPVVHTMYYTTIQGGYWNTESTYVCLCHDIRSMFCVLQTDYTTKHHSHVSYVTTKQQKLPKQTFNIGLLILGIQGVRLRGHVIYQYIQAYIRLHTQARHSIYYAS